jgi:hypothetical protein
VLGRIHSVTTCRSASLWVCGGGVVFLLFSVAAWWNMVKGTIPNRRNIGNFVAFNASVAVIGGAALVAGSSEDWPGLLLAAGACLGIGFLFGVLFGYPHATKTMDPQTTTRPTNGDMNATPKSDMTKPPAQGSAANQAPQAAAQGVPAGGDPAPPRRSE